MSEFTVSTRYANAFLNSIENDDQLISVSEELENVLDLLKSSKDLRKAISSPVISELKKIEIIDAVFGENVNEDVLKFLKFVIAKNRDNLFFDIIKRFIEIRDEKLSILRVTITSVVELPDEIKSKLVNELQQYSGKTVVPEYKTDESIIGGFLIRIGDTVIDASITNQLKILRKKFMDEGVSIN